MRKDEIIAESQVKASVVFDSVALADKVTKMNETEKCYLILDKITVTDGDENGTSGCSQVIYLGSDNDTFYAKMLKLADDLKIQTILYIKPEETAQIGCCVEVAEGYLYDKREVNFFDDLSCTFIDEINISYEEAVEHKLSCDAH